MNVLFSTWKRKMAAVASLTMAVSVFCATAQAAAPGIQRSAKAGTSLYELVFNPADGKLYVAAAGNRSGAEAAVNIVDPAGPKIVGQVPLAGIPVYGLGLNGRTQTLYGANTTGGRVVAIDLKTGKVRATIADPDNLEAHVRKVAVDEQANKAYVSVVGGFSEGPGKDGPKSAVWVIDGNTGTLEDVIVDPVKTATGLAVDPAAGRLYVADLAQNQIGVIDLATRKPVAYYRAYNETEVAIEKSEFSGKLDNGAQNLAIDPQGQRLFVTNPGSGTLTVVDARNGRLLKTVQTGKASLDVAWNAGAKQVYVTNRGAGGDGTVAVVDGDTYAVLAQLRTGTYPQSIAIDPATHAVFVSNKAKGLPRDATPSTPVPEDRAGDTVTVIRP